MPFAGRKIIIGVIGASTPERKLFQIAEEVGKEIALAGCVLICGGLGGVMEAVAKGAKANNGLTIGILPGNDSSAANNYIDIPIVSGMGEARNIVIVKSSDILIAIGKGYGTLSEIAFALKLNKPLIGIETWDVSPQIISFKDPRKAVKKAIELVRKYS
ncbi:MAG: TIGR00725 family protein [Candidatus Omnitrophica bacterium]|nr:TIGR00725 family protein [Candidatus Omnitrophota bacterium]MCM8793760.1 TIGR00725 family protein [Candidatus Omnitrophota bacterium]